MDDLISREYLKEHIEACWINGRPRYAPKLYEVLSWIDAVPSAQPDSKDLVEKIKNGITASDGNNEYFIGLRNGMRWCLSLIDDKEPIYESSAQPDHSGDVNEMVESAYTEGYTYAESKYRKMWDEMQATKQDAVEDTWDLFQMISSAWYGKGCYFKQNDGSVYSRLSCRYMTFDDAVRELMEKIDND